MIDRSDECIPLLLKFIQVLRIEDSVSHLIFTAVVFQLGTWESGPWTEKAKIWGHLPESKLWT